MESRAGHDRRAQILARVRGSGHIAVSDLAETLDVAKETVRRDLRVLEDNGLVRRAHGGAYPVEGANFESNLAYRSGSLVAEKQRIAAAVMDELGTAESIFIDEGFTPLLIAEELARSGRRLTVVTASLPGAAALAVSTAVEVILLGGRVRGRTMGTVDDWATGMLGTFVLDLAILGANGVTRDRGLTVPTTAVAAVKAKAMEVARRRIFAGVHTKFGVTSFCQFAAVSDFETLITDAGLSAHEAGRYAAMGPQVIRV